VSIFLEAMTSVVERLREFRWEEYGVEYVVLFGSAVESELFHDIDLAVRFRDYCFGKYVDLLCSLAAFMGVREDHIDLVVLDERTPAQLVLEIFEKGVVVYYRDWEWFIEDSLRLINISSDFVRDLEKLNVVETVVEGVKKSWE